MKKLILLILITIFCNNLCAFAIDYSNDANWVLKENFKNTNKQFDVFYVYPTIFEGKPNELFDWSKPEYNEKAKSFTIAQTSGFADKNIRIFAPFVRQLELRSALNEIEKLSIPNFDYSKSAGKYGINDTKEALKYYLKNYNNGRPYILLGHSQGAIDLLVAMKEIPLGKNFLAAYLIGCPNPTKELLSVKGVNLAKGKSDLGVIIVWNTQGAGVENKYFSAKNGYVINPLNWRCDEKPASRFKNSVSRFWDENSKSKTKPYKKGYFITGAKIDNDNGVLLVNLKHNSKFDVYGQIGGKGVFHVVDIWLFSDELVKNAKHRYNVYKKLNNL